mgnify:CR=1 FL=1
MMTRDELNNAYFDWMYQLVCDDEYSRGLSYRKLLYLLHDTDFTFTIALDSNRYDDGIDLRYRFGNEQGYRDSMIASYLDNRPCSVLEMIIKIKEISDFYFINKILSDSKTISESMVKMYDEHNEDLKKLKGFFKKYAEDQYKR